MTSAVGTPVVAIVGPTATGKTALGVWLCETLEGELIGADSVQVYRHCDIGAGKPTPEELRGVRHHLLDVAEPDAPLDAAQYAELADRAIAEVVQRGKVPVVVGGTGLWLRALLRGLLVLPKVDPELRRTLETEWQALGPEAMHGRLATVDPLAAAAIHPRDQVRVVRALEVYTQTGQALGELRRVHALGAPRYPCYGVYIDLPKAVYTQTVRTRIQGMIARGLRDEVAGLLERYGPGIRALSAVGYRQMVEHLQGVRDEQATLTEMTRATEQYGRRQRNWFRSEQAIGLRTTPEAAYGADVLQQIQDHLTKHR